MNFNRIISVQLIIAMLFTLSSCRSDKINVELKNELLAMVETDQQLRKEWIKDKDENLKEKIIKLDQIHTKRMHEILDTYGWPGIDIVGNEGSNAAWLLIQHADRNPELQQRALELLKAAVDKQNASATDLAYLIDRVLVNQNKPQRYGTQLDDNCIPKQIEDEAHVDERRKEVGLYSMQEYIELAKEYSK